MQKNYEFVEIFAIAVTVALNILLSFIVFVGLKALMQPNRKRTLTQLIFSLLASSGLLAICYPILQLNINSPVLNLIQFKMRHLPFMQDGKCRQVNRLFYFGSAVKRDAQLVEKINFRSPYPYEVKKVVLAPGGYIIAKIEQKGTAQSSEIYIIHTIIYKKSRTGKYFQLEDCQKGII